jgi:CheY-like chemotaxis protein
VKNNGETGKRLEPEKIEDPKKMIQNGDLEDSIGDENVEKTEEMIEYEKETGHYSVWRGIVTEGFKKWQKGEKIYNRDKERISLYVSEETKDKWNKFLENSKYTTISKLIRESVDIFIEDHNTQPNINMISNISHALKEPLTSIKGYSQLLLENFKQDLSEEVKSTVKNIFEQSIQLENKILKFLDNISDFGMQYDILLIEDDLATIRLITSYFESKGYVCKGIMTGSKAIEELNYNLPQVILLDIILPDLNGYDVCKIIKRNDRFNKIPLYYLTAISASEVEMRLKETGADGYILKPFNFTDFDKIFKILHKEN